MKWYVLQVEPGKEDDVSEALAQRQITALVPRETRMIRSGGTWRDKLYLLFPGYVFVHTNYTAGVSYILNAIPAVIGILCASGAPLPLSPEEAGHILWLAKHALHPSTARRLPDGRLQIVGGALLTLQKQIVRIDKHCRRATVHLPMLGQMKTIALSFEIISPREATPASAPESDRLIRPCSINGHI